MNYKGGKKAAQQRYYRKNRRKKRIALRRWVELNRAAHYANRLQWRIANTSKIMYHDARKRAKRKGLRFNLLPEDCAIPKRCPVLGIPLRYGTGFRHANSPSLDRIDNKKGYVRGNVIVISWRANSLKSNGTLPEFKKLVTWLKRVI